MATTLRTTLAGLGLLASMGWALAAEPNAPPRLISAADVIGITVKQTLISTAKAGSGPFDIDTAQAVEKFYEQHGNLPLWVDEHGYDAKAKLVIAELKRAADWGLNPPDYAVVEPAPAALSPAKLAEAELALTRAVVHYAHDAHVGRFEPARISELIDLMSTPPNATAVLSGLASAEDPAAFLTTFNPHHPEFQWLRQKYLALRGHDNEDTPVHIPDGPRLQPGDVSTDVPLLRQRLHVFAPANGNPQLYDEVLAVAVRDFEQKNGFKSDALVTPAVRRVLNMQLPAQPPKGAQIDKILANMERWRWLPEELGSSYVFDNIPEYMTVVMKDGQVIHSAKIVVGKPDTPTAIFSNAMKYVEFHPFWRIPDSIKVKELLPAIARGGGSALARRGLKIAMGGKEVDPSSIDFGSSDIRSYEIFQPPSTGNALGDVKFMFPNHYDIYMHDTPSKDLFAENVRAFSHGCMRVQNPQRFAEVVMSEGNGWSPDRVKQQFADAANMQVPLDKPLPVHVVYFTVRATADGQLSFLDDIYGHDKRVSLAVAGKWAQISKQLAPKSTVDPALMAGIRGDSYGSFSDGTGGGSFFDLFGNPTGDSGGKSRHGRHHHNTFFGDQSGFVGNSQRAGNPTFGNLFGF